MHEPICNHNLKQVYKVTKSGFTNNVRGGISSICELWMSGNILNRIRQTRLRW